MPYNPSQTLADLKVRGPRKPLKTNELTPHEARAEAQRMIHAGLVETRSKTRALIDVMGSAGILPATYLEELIDVHDRTIRRYREKNLLERVRTPPTLKPVLAPEEHLLYALGSVGQELATLIHGRTPTGYTEAEHDKISHDALCNVVYYHLYTGVKVLDYTATLYNRYEATIRDYMGKALLEPDAMVRLDHPDNPSQVFLIEYHHEDFGRRAEGKVLKYERVLRDHPDLWHSKWQTTEPPTVLAVWTHNAVGTGYRRYFEERRRDALRLHARWLGKPLQAFIERQTVLVWEDLGTAQPKTRLVQPVPTL